MFEAVNNIAFVRRAIFLTHSHSSSRVSVTDTIRRKTCCIGVNVPVGSTVKTIFWFQNTNYIDTLAWSLD